MAGHIGIVACSMPGALLCYETIYLESEARLGPHTHPEISLHAFSFAEHVRLLEAGDWPAIGTLLTRSAEKLASLGAQFVICPDNTVHQALTDESAPLPWLHIASVVADEARRTGARRLGILGTRYLMEGPVYPDKLGPAGLEWRTPPPAERAAVHQIIFEELVRNRVTDESRGRLAHVIDGLRERDGCDAVVLGCTELPLIVTADVSSLPTLDSTRLLARAAVTRAIDSA